MKMKECAFFFLIMNIVWVIHVYYERHSSDKWEEKSHLQRRSQIEEH